MSVSVGGSGNCRSWPPLLYMQAVYMTPGSIVTRRRLSERDAFLAYFGTAEKLAETVFECLERGAYSAAVLAERALRKVERG